MSTYSILLCCFAAAWFLGVLVFGHVRRGERPAPLDDLGTFLVAAVPALAILFFGPGAEMSARAESVQTLRVAGEAEACKSISAQRFVVGGTTLCRDGQNRLYAVP